MMPFCLQNTEKKKKIEAQAQGEAKKKMKNQGPGMDDFTPFAVCGKQWFNESTVDNQRFFVPCFSDVDVSHPLIFVYW
jgi:hypothetical protein